MITDRHLSLAAIWQPDGCTFDCRGMAARRLTFDCRGMAAGAPALVLRYGVDGSLAVQGVMILVHEAIITASNSQDIIRHSRNNGSLEIGCRVVSEFFSGLVQLRFENPPSMRSC